MLFLGLFFGIKKLGFLRFLSFAFWEYTIIQYKFVNITVYYASVIRVSVAAVGGVAAVAGLCAYVVICSVIVLCGHGLGVVGVIWWAMCMGVSGGVVVCYGVRYGLRWCGLRWCGMCMGVSGGGVGSMSAFHTMRH